MRSIASSPAQDPALRLSEVIGALSYALDLTDGQPMGHSVRTCAIAMHLAEALHLPAASRPALFHAALIKDAGCSTTAAPLTAQFGVDDRRLKHDLRLADADRASDRARLLVRHAGAGRGGGLRRLRAIAAAARDARPETARALYATRCERGAEIARMIGLGDEAADAIASFFERWDGSGEPAGLAGDAIPVLARVIGLAQSFEVFATARGRDAAFAMATARSGTWFDPALVQALGALRDDTRLWRTLDADVADEPETLLRAIEPEESVAHADGARLDRIAEAFARVIDAKSPFTFHHSGAVADLSVAIAGRLGQDETALQGLRRAALLHDIGKLGVSNLVLDKPGPLTPREWREMRWHTEHTYRVLHRVSAFRPLAAVAAAHHERLDGSGYHRGLEADRLAVGARILAVADVAEALSSERPYRSALPPEEVLAIMAREVPRRLDAEAFAALQGHLDGA